MSEKGKTQDDLEFLAGLLVGRLHYGHEFAQTRSELCERLGMNDRAMRKLLEYARNNGVLICNDQDGAGYYLAATDEEIERQYRREKSRMVNHWNAMRPFYEAVKERGLQT